MNKKIEFDYKGKHYTLEYTRRSIVQLEQQGLKVAEIQNAPLSTLPKLFQGAFLAHHRGISQDLVDEIYELLPDKEKLITTLGEMYYFPFETLMAEPKKGEAVEWTANF